MASFQAKIGWKRPRKRENRNYRSVPFLPDASQKIPKNSKKMQKIKKSNFGLTFSQNSSEKNEKERK